MFLKFILKGKTFFGQLYITLNYTLHIVNTYEVIKLHWTTITTQLSVIWPTGQSNHRLVKVTPFGNETLTALFSISTDDMDGSEEDL